MIAPRHALVAEDELRKEGQIETAEDQHRGEARPHLGIHPSGDLRPPEMQGGEEGGHHAAHHDVVEMRDDEISLRHMDVDRQRREEEPGQPAQGEEADEAERIEHRRVERNRTLV